MKKMILMLGLAIGMFSNVLAEEQRVEADLTAFEFNEVSSQYMPRPTFAKIEERKSESKLVMVFEMSGYGNGWAKFEVAKEFVDENVEAISKYLKWAAMAKERGDTLDKEVAIVRGVDTGIFYVWNEYKFHSGNAKSHFLVISIGTKTFGHYSSNNQMSKNSIIFDEENANRLIKRLLEFKEGKIPQTKVEDYK